MEQFKEMWTTEKHNFVLEKNLGGFTGYNIFQIDPFGFVIIEDDGLAVRVVENMLNANVKIVDSINELGHIKKPPLNKNEFLEWAKSLKLPNL
jgi:hypothetical protein